MVKLDDKSFDTRLHQLIDDLSPSDLDILLRGEDSNIHYAPHREPEIIAIVNSAAGGDGISRERLTKLREAAKCSTGIREDHLFIRGNIEYDKFASGVALIIPSSDHSEIEILVVDRHPRIGKGLCVPGGFLEEEDNGNFLPIREMVEELGEGASTSHHQRIRDMAQGLTMTPLMGFGDFTFFINNGWGRKSQSHMLFAKIDRGSEAHDLINELCLIDRSHIPASEREVLGMQWMKLPELINSRADFRYPHELIGCLEGVNALQRQEGFRESWMINMLFEHKIGMLEPVTDRLRLRPDDLRHCHETMRRQEFAEPGKPANYVFTPEQYREAFVAKNAKAELVLS